jgi:large subunit ribosomal protein L4
VDGDTPSTKDGRAVLAGVTEARRVLVVADRDDRMTWLSLRNLPNVHLIAPGQLNTYDVLVSDDVVFTADAFRAFVAGRSGSTAGTAVARESELSALDAGADEAEEDSE